MTESHSEIISSNQMLAAAYRAFLWHMQMRATGCVLIPVRFVHPVIENDGSLSLYYDHDGDHVPLRSFEQLDPEGPIENGSYRYYFTTLEKAIEAAKSSDGFDGFSTRKLSKDMPEIFSASCRQSLRKNCHRRRWLSISQLMDSA